MTVVVHGAERGGSLASMADDWADPRDAFSREGGIVGARHEDLARNHPVAAAMIDSIIEPVIGPDGLEFYSNFQLDPSSPVTDDRDLEVQDQINTWVAEATAGMRYDAAGMRTFRDLNADVLWCSLLAGTGIATRSWKPQRGGDPLTGYAARVIHPRRISNPDHRPDHDRLVHGFSLDDSGDPVAMHIKTHRGALSARGDRWATWPLYGRDGLRNVLLETHGHHPEQIMGFGVLTPVIELLKSFTGTIKAYVVGKQIQASFPIIIQSSDPKVLEAAKKLGCYLGPENANKVRIRPNRVLITPANCEHIFKDLKFSGSDMKEFADGIIAQACAAIGAAPDLVMKRLPRSSLSSARAAVADHWRMVLCTRARHCDYILHPIIEWIIAEGRIRGAIDVPEEVPLRRLVAGSFEGLAMPEPDPAKAVDTVAALIHDVGASQSTGFRRLGLNYRKQVLQRSADNRWADGVEGARMPAVRQTQGAGSVADGDPDDAEREAQTDAA